MHALAMAAAAFFSWLTRFLSFLREHPKLSCLLLLLLSPPIYRILLYFTPLLLSTALCIFALITLAPYVTATDAEVERQSLLGASSYQRKKSSTTTTCTSKGEKGAPGGHGNFPMPSSSASLPTSSLSAASSTAAVCPSPSPRSCAAENSWMSWMKGLNDIGRAWVESKLVEQGLALSEPANRETLLALIEGSFAELVNIKEDYTDICSVGAINTVGADNNVMQLKDTDDDLSKRNQVEEATRDPLQQTRNVVDELECLVDNVVEVNGGSKEARMEEPLPISVMESRADESAPRAEEQRDNADSCASDESKTEISALESEEGFSVPSGTLSKQIISQLLSHDTKMKKEKPHTPLYESTLPVIDASTSAHAISMPKTPSRIPAPSKLLEASRRIFSKEEQSKSMLPRAPFQVSSLGRVQAPKTPSAGSPAQSKTESTISVLKLPTRRFLERSKSIPAKEASKLGNSISMENQAASAKVDKECRPVQGKVNVESDFCKPDVNEGMDVLSGALGDFTDGIDGNGPKFDEDLEVEEAQALVQSELKMLEVELEEVAAKLPMLHGALAYQKTPVKTAANATTLLSPTRTPFRSNMTLFSASPISK